MGIIYKVTYQLDPNIIYIGQSVLSLSERRRQHERNPNVWRFSDDSFDKILLKKGLDNWKWEILENNLETKEELDRAEIGAIKLYEEKGFKLLNIIHNPLQYEKKHSNYGAAKAWDETNQTAHKARYYTGKIRPVMNLTSGKKYKTITELRDKENVSTPLINKLCETGEPHPQNGNQYAFLDLNDNPILKEGHNKVYPLLQKIEIVEINTGTSSQLNLFAAASVIGCNLGELMKMKILNLGGKRNDITCKGFIIFALHENGERIETISHTRNLERTKENSEPVFIWLWNKVEAKWQFEKKVDGYAEASKFLSDIFDVSKPSFFRNKISEILKGKRTHIQGYTFTSTPEIPNSKPIMKLQPVILLNAKDGNIVKYENATTAAEELGLNSQHIMECCKGKIISTGGYRFAWADKNDQPIYRKRHNDYLRKMTGLGTSVYWVEGEKTFHSIAECKRYLDELCAKEDPRVLFVPKREKLAKIASGEVSNVLGSGIKEFKITLKMIK